MNKMGSFLVGLAIVFGMAVLLSPQAGLAAEKAQMKMTTPAERQGFNPQPEPPGEEQNAVLPGEAEGFNPQPEPPRWKASGKTSPSHPGWIVDDNRREWRPAQPSEVKIIGGKAYLPAEE